MNSPDELQCICLSPQVAFISTISHMISSSLKMTPQFGSVVLPACNLTALTVCPFFLFRPGGGGGSGAYKAQSNKVRFS